MEYSLAFYDEAGGRCFWEADWPRVPGVGEWITADTLAQDDAPFYQVVTVITDEIALDICMWHIVVRPLPAETPLPPELVSGIQLLFHHTEEPDGTPVQ